MNSPLSLFKFVAYPVIEFPQRRAGSGFPSTRNVLRGLHVPLEAPPLVLAALLALLALAAATGRWLARDFIAHPANFPSPTPSTGVRLRPPR